MNYLVWLFSGSVLGWLATILLRRRQANLWFNIIVGMVGAFVAGYLVFPMFHIRTIDRDIFSLPALLVSLVGAVILLAAVNFLRREKNVKNDFIESKWELVHDHIHARWGKLTEADIDTINGNHNQFIGTLQARYGFDKKEAEDQIQRYVKSISGLT